MKRSEINSLNQELPTLFVDELEQRLETDPLAVGGLLDGFSNSEVQSDLCIFAAYTVNCRTENAYITK